jgi:hypothetical protein
MTLGLEVENIHASKNDCILYHRNALFVISIDSIIEKLVVMTRIAIEEMEA